MLYWINPNILNSFQSVAELPTIARRIRTHPIILLAILTRFFSSREILNSGSDLFHTWRGSRSSSRCGIIVLWLHCWFLLLVCILVFQCRLFYAIRWKYYSNEIVMGIYDAFLLWAWLGILVAIIFGISIVEYLNPHLWPRTKSKYYSWRIN